MEKKKKSDEEAKKKQGKGFDGKIILYAQKLSLPISRAAFFFSGDFFGPVSYQAP
jgi:hypothetical protein